MSYPCVCICHWPAIIEGQQYSAEHQPMLALLSSSFSFSSSLSGIFNNATIITASRIVGWSNSPQLLTHRPFKPVEGSYHDFMVVLQDCSDERDDGTRAVGCDGPETNVCFTGGASQTVSSTPSLHSIGNPNPVPVRHIPPCYPVFIFSSIVPPVLPVQPLPTLAKTLPTALFVRQFIITTNLATLPPQPPFSLPHLSQPP